MSVSVLTIVRGRRSRLLNQRAGLLQSRQLPDQWIIVGMDEEITLPVDDKLPTRIARVDGDGSRLPLAEARNRAAALCQTEQMIFLDVDCIPHPEMIGTFAKTIEQQDGLWMGSARYLPAGAAETDWTMDQLQRLAVRHPLQPELEIGQQQRSDRYEMFWSLCFGTTRSSFAAIGGFDESFRGYGGEDTDFAFAARQAEVPFGFVGAFAFHQHHEVHKPPVNHFHPIVENAKRFREKWGSWPMESWLNAFAQWGLVRFEPKRDLLQVLREPTADEIERSRSPAPAGF